MKRRYLVHIEEPKHTEGWIELAAVHESPDGARWRVWYRVPEAWGDALTDLADPFAVGSVQQAMLHGSDLEVRGAVSRSLLANLEDYVDVWHCWDGTNYSRIELGATRETEPEPSTSGEAICSFSGGVDSYFTVLRHAKRLAGRRSKDIGAAVLVHGFDIPLGDTSGFQGAFARAAEGLHHFAIPLIPVVTNWRDNGIDWLNSFGSAATACLHLFQRRFRSGLIASSETYAYQAPQGASPLIDRMLSNSSFEIIHDGAGFTRSQKVALLAPETELVRRLRVCWEGEQRDRNCGVCEKCIRTILNFRAIGCAKPEVFPTDVTIDQIRRIPIRNMPILNEFREIAAEAGRQGMGKERWVAALQRRLRKAQRELASPPRFQAIKKTAVWQALRKIRNKVRNRAS
jgi:hypothetical protein